MKNLAAILLMVNFVQRCSTTCHTSENDCSFAFGEWSDCDPCSKLSSRQVNITSPPHFDGFPCPNALTETSPCTPNAECPKPLPCAGKFNCRLAGEGAALQCIDDALVCNGQRDCINNEDEFNCTSKVSANVLSEVDDCSSLPTIPYLDQMGSGVHLGSGELMGKVLDMSRFNGFCRLAFTGNIPRDLVYNNRQNAASHQKTMRLPYNVNDMHAHVKSSDSLTVKSYDSLASYKTEQDHQSSTKFSEEFHLSWSGFSASVSVDQSMSYSHSEAFKEIYEGMKDQKSILFTVTAQFEVAQFSLRRENLLLDGFFEEAVNRLPVKFNSKIYMDLFDQFGVFYVQAGKLGGRYQHNYVFETSTLAQSHFSEKSMSKCLNFAISGSASFGLFGHVDVSASASYEHCTDDHGTQQTSTKVTQSAASTIVHVDGGTSEAAGQLVGESMTGDGSNAPSKFQDWAAGITDNPVLIERTLAPICDLILSAHSSHVQEKYDNCMKAMKLRLQRMSAADCTGCKNGGEAVRMNGQCQCVCTAYYTGQACAQAVQDPAYHRDYQYVMGKSILDSLPGAGREQGRRFKAGNRMIRGAKFVEGHASQSDIKFITTGNPPVAHNPPFMNRFQLQENDFGLKSKEDRIYYAKTTRGGYLSRKGTGSGSVAIVQLNEYLEVVATTPINFANISACNSASGGTVFCGVSNYDIDIHDNFAVFLTIDSQNGMSMFSQNAIYRIDRLTGNPIDVISDPCVGETDTFLQSLFVSTTCADSLVVSCPGIYSVATVKTFTLSGHAQGLSQFAGYSFISGVQHFSNQVWIRTKANQVAAFSLTSWDEVFNFTSNFPFTGDHLMNTQLFVDFAENLILAQDHSAGTNDKVNAKLTMVDTNTKTVLAHVMLDHWTNCKDVAAYRGKLFVLCDEVVDSSAETVPRSILVFDYLK